MSAAPPGTGPAGDPGRGAPVGGGPVGGGPLGGAATRPGRGPSPASVRLLRAVAAAEVARWLPRPARVLDLTTTTDEHTRALRAAGHEVVHVVTAPARGTPGLVRADPAHLAWVADSTVDAVLAEDGVLSRSLATEVTVADVVRVLRPGGRLLACVDSLLGGLAGLAEQGPVSYTHLTLPTN